MYSYCFSMDLLTSRRQVWRARFGGAFGWKRACLGPKLRRIGMVVSLDASRTKAKYLILRLKTGFLAGSEWIFGTSRSIILMFRTWSFARCPLRFSSVPPINVFPQGPGQWKCQNHTAGWLWRWNRRFKSRRASESQRVRCVFEEWHADPMDKDVIAPSARKLTKYVGFKKYSRGHARVDGHRGGSTRH